MLFLCLCEDQNVIQIHYHDSFGYEGPEDVVHHSLEGSRTIGHSEEHHEGFEEAAVGMEGCLPFVSGLDTYIIETPLDVKLCEVLGSAELGDELRDKGEGVLVLDSCSVQRAERGKRDVDCDKQVEKAVTAPNCVLKGSWGEGGSGGIRKKLKSEYAAYLESKYRRNDGSSI